MLTQFLLSCRKQHCHQIVHLWILLSLIIKLSQNAQLCNIPKVWMVWICLQNINMCVLLCQSPEKNQNMKWCIVKSGIPLLPVNGSLWLPFRSSKLDHSDDLQQNRNQNKKGEKSSWEVWSLSFFLKKFSFCHLQVDGSLRVPSCGSKPVKPDKQAVLVGGLPAQSGLQHSLATLTVWQVDKIRAFVQGAQG